MKRFYISILSLAFFNGLHAQVAINTTKTPANSSAMLDISSTSKGLLIPRIELTGTTDVNTIKSPATSLLIYNTATAGASKFSVVPGYYYYSGISWVPLASTPATTGNAWLLGGNQGILEANNFLGTTDNQPLKFRVNNLPAAEISPTTGNVVFGVNSLILNTSGTDNVGLGTVTLNRNTTGSGNVAIGNSAFRDNTTGNGNTAVGQDALVNNEIGDDNTAIGKKALFSNKTGYGNVVVGAGAMSYADFAHNIVAVGDSALYNQRDNPDFYYGNTAVGSKALFENSHGQSNTAIGYQSLFANESGNQNTAVGTYSLYGNVSGLENTAMGYNALLKNYEGNSNTAMGANALYFNEGGNENSGFGLSAMAHNTYGKQNTAVGFRSLFNNETSNYNTALGGYALYASVGSTNTAIGNSAMYGNKTGYGNVAVGYQALQYNTTGYNNTVIGTNAGPANGSGDIGNSTAIGQGATFTASNQVRLGNSSVSSIGGYSEWKNISDIRFKKNVKAATHGLDFILKLEPITYNLDVQKLNHFMYGQAADTIFKTVGQNAISLKESVLTSGFSAQQVETVAKSIGYDFNGVEKPQNDKDHYSLSYSSFVVPLVKAVQEQQQQIEVLKAKNEALGKAGADQQKLNEDLLKRLLKLEAGQAVK